MKRLTALVALLLASCGTADKVRETTGGTTQRFASSTPILADDRPLADRMTEANAADFETTDMDAVSPDLSTGTSAASDRATVAAAATTGTRHDAAAPMTQASVTQYGSCSDGKRVCGDMTDCADAVFHLEQCGMTRLDRDHDGTPCEKICG